MLATRSYTKELLDSELIPFADIRRNMEELDFINKWLGGHGITLSGFRQLLGSKTNISVCEIGCGGGDNLAAISGWCKQKNITIQVTGIDIKQECVDLAASRGGFGTDDRWIARDYRNVTLYTKPDIIFSSLFCHHFTDEELVEQVKWMQQNCRVGFFINDLQRNILAYYSIKVLTRVFSRSYLVKNDAPLSVARGFRRNELISICKRALLQEAGISWKWAFRYLVVYNHIHE